MKTTVYIFMIASLLLSNCTKNYSGSETPTDYIVLQSDGIMVQKNDITSGSNRTAAYNLCTASRVGGYNDWRLPTQGELQTLYNQRTTIGGFSTTSSGSYYWSSSQDIGVPYIYIYVLNFNNGNGDFYMYDTNDSYRARAVRSLP